MSIARRQIAIRGQVQGVGFRPHVYRLATGLGLAGSVINDSDGVRIDIEGPAARIDEFVTALRSAPPPLAVIEAMNTVAAKPTGQRGFEIRKSERADQSHGRTVQEARITPDVRICDDCLREIRDSADRRHGYPFANCTNCGPRYSIIHEVPYDRPNTTMAGFTMCPACQAEYEDPGTRRFHAQPNACPQCGPRVWLVRPDGSSVAGEAIAEAAAALANGRIVAIKGLGGFHLACRADRAAEATVVELRRRKLRDTKPFAVMVPNLAAARQLAEVGDEDVRLLQSPAAPIVLLPARPDAELSSAVAPGSGSIGLMLPYTPLHFLLFDQGLGPLVMTSGNPSDEPLCAGNDEALRRLGPLADLLLLHDRDIHARHDDSVIVGGVSPPIPLRRSRGYVPGGLSVPVQIGQPILALGGDLKVTFCVLSGSDAVLSEHLGELPSAEAFRHYARAIERLSRLLRTEPCRLVHDLHPGYQSTAYARDLARRMGSVPLAVQHHHAHLVSCLAEHGETGRAVGLIGDGTGYGTDGTIWGCEVLVGDAAGFERAGHLRPYRLPGGDAGAKQTWRPALSLLRETFGPSWRDACPDAVRRMEPGAAAAVEQVLERNVNCPRTSSLGRLFDAVGFLLGLGDRNDHEAQAAMAVEAAAMKHGAAPPLPYAVQTDANGGPDLLDVRPTLEALLQRLVGGVTAGELAGAFHASLAAMLADAAERAASRYNVEVVALSGGCFLNRLLTAGVRDRLRSRGLKVLSHERIPPGDGGLALGQAVVGAVYWATNERN